MLITFYWNYGLILNFVCVKYMSTGSFYVFCIRRLTFHGDGKRWGVGSSGEVVMDMVQE